MKRNEVAVPDGSRAISGDCFDSAKMNEHVSDLAANECEAAVRIRPYNDSRVFLSPPRSFGRGV